MRAFLTTIVRFTLPALLYFAVVGAINLRTLTAEQLPIHSRVLALGDSHIGCGLDTSIIQGSQNLALPAEPFLLTWFKLKRIHRDHPIDTLLIGVAPHNIVERDHTKFREMGWATDRTMKRFYPLFSPLTAFELPMYHKAYVRTVFMQMCTVPRKSHIHYLGHFSGLRKEFRNDSSATIKRHFSETNGSPSPVSAFGLSYLDSIVNYAHSERIVLYLIGAPVHPTYLAQVPPAVRTKYDALMEDYRSRGEHVINATAMFTDDELFANSDHLSRKGARVFSRFVRATMLGIPADSLSNVAH